MFKSRTTHNKQLVSSQSPDGSAQSPQTSLCLCSPTPDTTCFACCPPIRPAQYDPLDFVSSLRREFQENRFRYRRHGPRYRPIVGYHCWALGFLDQRGRRVGCLLHPLQNHGADLRHLIDFGQVCSQELCFAAKVFTRLPPEGQRFWLPLVEGLSPFYYSSSRANPLFHILPWGQMILERLRQQATVNQWTVTELLWHNSFVLKTKWNPRAHRYLFHLLLQSRFIGVRQVDWKFLEQRVDELLSTMPTFSNTAPKPSLEGQLLYVHQWPVAKDFSDFLRLHLGWNYRVTFDEIRLVRDHLQSQVAEMAS